MTTLYIRTMSSPSHPTHPSPQPSTPTSIPPFVYRVHRNSAQTRYSFSTGFSAKNHTTILNYTSALSRFGLAHLHQQTNISSPFISVYDKLSHAEAVARHFATKYGEDTMVVEIDTRHLARGPVFRAEDLLRKEEEERVEWLHEGEYLVMYSIPRQAIRGQTPVARGEGAKRDTVGVIGRP